MKVNLVIDVPGGKYCWDRKYKICEYYSSEGGTNDCELDLGDQKDDKIGVLKPLACLKLTEEGNLSCKEELKKVKKQLKTLREILGI